MIDECFHKVRNVFHTVFLVFVDVLSVVEVMNGIDERIHRHSAIKVGHFMQFKINDFKVYLLEGENYQKIQRKLG